ncbi:hypothetical protein FPOAC2_01081 [Fusarium poae]|jgi:hypothetical protein
MDVSFKPIKAGSLAVNSLHHPAPANPPPAMRAIEAYKYLIDFTPYKDVINLVEELPGINGVVKGSGFDHLVNVFSKMNSVTNVGIHLSLVLLGVASRICLSFSSYVSFMALVKQSIPSTSRGHPPQRCYIFSSTTSVSKRFTID